MDGEHSKADYIRAPAVEGEAGWVGSDGWGSGGKDGAIGEGRKEAKDRMVR